MYVITFDWMCILYYYVNVEIEREDMTLCTKDLKGSFFFCCFADLKGVMA